LLVSATSRLVGASVTYMMVFFERALERARTFRERANEIRKQIDAERDAATRDKIARLAKQYEDMAEREIANAHASGGAHPIPFVAPGPNNRR
jgi:hypothetical protein